VGDVALISMQSLTLCAASLIESLAASLIESLMVVPGRRQPGDGADAAALDAFRCWAPVFPPTAFSTAVAISSGTTSLSGLKSLKTTEPEVGPSKLTTVSKGAQP
jgi:hypothetical protein